MNANAKPSLGLYTHLINFYGIYLVVVDHVRIDIGTTVNHNKCLLVLSIYAACFTHVDHPQALKCVTLKPKIKCIYTFLICEICMHFILGFKVMYFNACRLCT
jgi:hypothetical protein